MLYWQFLLYASYNINLKNVSCKCLKVYGNIGRRRFGFETIMVIFTLLFYIKKMLFHSDYLFIKILIKYFRSFLRRKHRFKKDSTGWMKYQNKLSSTNGKSTPAAQLPLQGQSTRDVQLPIQGQSTPDVQLSLQGQSTPVVQLPLQGQSTPAVQLPSQEQSTPDVQLPLQGQSTPAAQLPSQGQSTPAVQLSSQGQSTPAVQLPLQGQSTPAVQLPLQGQSTPAVQLPLQGQSTPAVQLPLQGQSTPAIQLSLQVQSTPAVQLPLQEQSTPAVQLPLQGQSTPAVQLSLQVQSTPAVQLPLQGQSTPAAQLPSQGQSTPAVQLSSQGQSTPAVQLPLQGQSTPAVQLPLQGQSTPAVQLPLQGQSTPAVQLPLQGQSTPAVQLPSQAAVVSNDGKNTSATQQPTRAAAMKTNRKVTSLIQQTAQAVVTSTPPVQQSAQVDMVSACQEISNLSTEVLMSSHENNVPVPDADDSKDRIYKPMTSRMVCNTGTPDAATDCIQALQSCPRSRAHEIQHRSNATDARLARSTLFRASSSNASFHPTVPLVRPVPQSVMHQVSTVQQPVRFDLSSSRSGKVPFADHSLPTVLASPIRVPRSSSSILPNPRLSTHLPQMTGHMSSVQPAHQLKLSSNNPDNVAFADYLLASGFANPNFVGDKLPGC